MVIVLSPGRGERNVTEYTPSLPTVYVTSSPVKMSVACFGFIVCSTKMVGSEAQTSLPMSTYLPRLFATFSAAAGSAATSGSDAAAKPRDLLWFCTSRLSVQ